MARTLVVVVPLDTTPVVVHSNHNGEVVRVGRWCGCTTGGRGARGFQPREYIYMVALRPSRRSTLTVGKLDIPALSHFTY